MEKFSLDYNGLNQVFNKKKTYRLSDVKDKIEKVAWDVVRFRDNEDVDMLWKIEESPDGPIIVALYDEDTGGLKTESEKLDWSVVKQGKQLHVFYKDAHLTSLDKGVLGIPEDEFNLISRWLPKKIASDEEYQAFILSRSGNVGISFIQSKYPELQKIASKATSIANDVDVERKDLVDIAEGIKNA